MRLFAYIATLTLIMVSCGTDSKHFKLEGRLLNLNQGEFYVYSPDGGIEGFDTIRVEAGRFVYQTECEHSAILMLVFPNFSEQPIFMEPGESVTLDGDASHLKEITTKGTKDNKLMNGLREQMASASPPKRIEYAKQFIEDHPESLVSSYLLYKYFLQTTTPNYTLAKQLLALMLKEQPRNGFLVRMQQQVEGLANTEKGKALSSFSATDIKGNTVSSAALSKADCAVITAWATWDYNAYSTLSTLKELKSTAGNKLAILTVSVDASKETVKTAVESNELSWNIVCDEQLFGGKLIRSLGFFSPTDNIVLQRGKIVARNLKNEELKKKVEELTR